MYSKNWNRLSSISTTTKKYNSDFKTIREWINISTLDILFCVTLSFILVKTIFIYHYIFICFSLLWPDLLEFDSLETILFLYIFIPMHLIQTNHIWRYTYITITHHLVTITIFSPGEAYIFWIMYLQLSHHLWKMHKTFNGVRA